VIRILATADVVDDGLRMSPSPIAPDVVVASGDQRY
jgi:hypothetical protein